MRETTKEADDAVRAAARTVTFTDAVAALKACVAERGADYVYPHSGDTQLDRPTDTEWTGSYGGCLNVTQPPDGSLGKPACIIGCAYAHLGVPVEWMAQGFRITDGSMATAENLAAMGWDIVADVRELFSDVQNAQDTGVPWGKAVSDAIGA